MRLPFFFSGANLLSATLPLVLIHSEAGGRPS